MLQAFTFGHAPADEVKNRSFGPFSWKWLIKGSGNALHCICKHTHPDEHSVSIQVSSSRSREPDETARAVLLRMFSLCSYVEQMSRKKDLSSGTTALNLSTDGLHCED